ncbi:hypothetical protein NSE_0424 [Neorickettsia sennetsu str. Miyayama]|uniref:Uncharacterized protein n=1 Tax=Ehrlichia sennetsu (strain ATCC VR-367 / Miyayama) TaxID=222891 RepID=Q2GDY6_EHRS3|nr:hypothetical protein NSE_0424 [Neorickettsia sennetsu str. Miyayama]
MQPVQTEELQGLLSPSREKGFLKVSSLSFRLEKEDVTLIIKFFFYLSIVVTSDFSLQSLQLCIQNNFINLARSEFWR